jgi:hypothetical protein
MKTDKGFEEIAQPLIEAGAGLLKAKQTKANLDKQFQMAQNEQILAATLNGEKVKPSDSKIFANSVASPLTLSTSQEDVAKLYNKRKEIDALKEQAAADYSFNSIFWGRDRKEFNDAVNRVESGKGMTVAQTQNEKLLNAVNNYEKAKFKKKQELSDMEKQINSDNLKKIDESIPKPHSVINTSNPLKNDLSQLQSSFGKVQDANTNHLNVGQAGGLMGTKKTDGMLGDVFATQQNLNKNPNMIMENVMYGEMANQQKTAAKIDTQGGIKSAVATDVTESMLKASQQKSSVESTVKSFAENSGMSKSQAEEFSKAMVEGAKSGKELLKSGILEAAGALAGTMNEAKVKSDIATVDKANAEGSSYGGFVGLNVANAKNQTEKNLQQIRSAEGVAEFMAAKGNKSFMGKNGALKGADALLAVTKSQGSEVNNVISDDGKTEYGMRIDKNGNANISKYDRGVSMNLSSLAFGELRDAGDKLHKATGIGDDNLGTTVVETAGAIGGGFILNKFMGNPLGRLKRRISPVVENSVNNLSKGASVPTHSNLMGGLAGKTAIEKEIGTEGLKMAGKKIPFGIGAAISLSSATSRFKKGDMVGAGLDLASGVASIVPGIGTAASFAIDGLNMARDVSHSGGLKQVGVGGAMKSLAIGGAATAGVIAANEMFNNSGNVGTQSLNNSSSGNKPNNQSQSQDNTTTTNKNSDSNSSVGYESNNANPHKNNTNNDVGSVSNYPNVGGMGAGGIDKDLFERLTTAMENMNNNLGNGNNMMASSQQVSSSSNPITNIFNQTSKMQDVNVGFDVDDLVDGIVGSLGNKSNVLVT